MKRRSSMKRRRRYASLRGALLFIPYLLALTSAAGPLPAPRTVDLSAPDGTNLKATYFGAVGSGPGVLLLHQCNRQRKVWDGLAGKLASAGRNHVTLLFHAFQHAVGWRV